MNETSAAPEEPAPQTEVSWPHQYGDVSHADLQQHYTEHPEQYPAKFKPIVERVLAEHDASDDEAKFQTVRQILDDVMRNDVHDVETFPDSVEIFRLVFNRKQTAPEQIRPDTILRAMAQDLELSAEAVSELKVTLYSRVWTAAMNGEGFSYNGVDQDEKLKNELQASIPLDEHENEQFRQKVVANISRGVGDWDYIAPSTSYFEVKRLVRELSLDAGLIDTWRTNAAKDYLEQEFSGRSPGASAVADMQSQLDTIGFDENDRRKLASDVHLDLLRYGRGLTADKLQKALIPDVQFSDDELRVTGEAGLRAWNGDGDEAIDDLIYTYKHCKVSEMYIRQPEIYEHIATELGKQLYGYNQIDNVQKALSDISLPPEAIAIIDKTGAEHLEEGYGVLPFIGALGDANKQQQFPIMYETSLKYLQYELEQDEDAADYFIERLSSFADNQPWLRGYALTAVQHYSVANKFLQAMGHDPVWAGQPWVQDVLAKAEEEVMGVPTYPTGDWESDESYGGQEIEARDPHENHPYAFTAEQVKFASALTKFFAGKPTTAALENLQILDEQDAKALTSKLKGINSDIDIYCHNLDLWMTDHGMDTQELGSDTDVRRSALQVNIRGYVARFIAQSIDSEKPLLKEITRIEATIDKVISEGMQAYKQVLEVDVPLYDKLYEEFDDLRADGRKPMEVYLGRDGIYAWIGRRAQDAARRQKAVAEGWQRSEILEIHPKYVIYPRYFRDRMNRDAQREYLEQADIGYDKDPIFYDTGYTGTIPEQIMRVMGFDREEVERRIRLLSASQAHRRVRGITENARADIIEKIEHNSKLENPAEGMVRDEATGRLRHIAEPTSPREQFRFLMIQQAISRHYWYKERQAGRAADVRAPEVETVTV